MEIKGLRRLAVTLAFAGSATLSFGATAANVPPVISGTPPTSVVQGSQYVFQPTASDPDGDPVSFGVWNKPSWATLNPATGRLSGTPGPGDVGVAQAVFIVATDGIHNTNLGPFNITVLAANRPPVISGTPPTSVVQGSQYVFQPTASDPDGDPVSFGVWNKPSWATIDPATGRLSGTPGPADVGTASAVFIVAYDGRVNTNFGPFNIAVLPATNRPPVISGTPPSSVLQGTQYVFQPTASDPDGDRLTFGVWNKPSWATIDPATGRLSGTPGPADVGTASAIFIVAYDGRVNTNFGPFNIAVLAAANRPPVISGTPPTSVLQGTQYAFQPTASDPDGDPVSFGVWNKPSWATLNPATGRLSGTPGPGDVGVAQGVFIVATDGIHNTNLGPFNITVTGVATGSATLSWQTPTQNTDGSPLTDLAGFKVYWGTAQGAYPNSVTLTNAGLTRYVVGSLVSGTYFFAMTAFNMAGTESSLTGPVSKTIP